MAESSRNGRSDGASHSRSERSHRDDEDHRDRKERPGRSSRSHRSRSSRSPDDAQERRGHRRRDRDDSGRRRDRHRDEGGSGGGDLREEDDDVGPAPPPRSDPRLAELGVAPLTEEDYFLKAAEFKAWLAESKGKYLDEIPSKEARRYFGKFVDRWNDGRLSDDFYLGKVRSAAAPSSSQTRHKWGFAQKATYTQAEQDALASVRDTVDTMTNASTRGAREAREAERRASKGKRPRVGDEGGEVSTATGANAGAADSGWGANRSGAASSGTSYAERQFEREAAQEASQREEAAKRRRSKRDARELAEELAPRATGRDALIEKRRERNAANREFADRKDDDGFELDEATLMGGADDYSAALRARTQGAGRREQAKQERKQERQSEMNERVAAMRSKEQDTMAMFKQMAQQRFGGGG